MQKRTRYSREFKLEAVRQLERGDRTAVELARELGGITGITKTPTIRRPAHGKLARPVLSASSALAPEER